MIQHPTLNTIPGDFSGDLNAGFTLTTAQGQYTARVVSYSGLSRTEKRGLIIRTAAGDDVMTDDYIRAYGKRGLRVNCKGMGRWDSEVAAIEALTRHHVARFEAYKAVAA